MARLSDLVALMEEHRVDTGASLTIFARRLREAGRVSKSGRGRSAASMTALDAARFAIAVLATDSPERAADAENVYSGMVLSNWSEMADMPIPFDRDGKPTLDVFLADILERIGAGEIDAIAHDRAKAATPEGKKVFHIAPTMGIDLFRSAVTAVIQISGTRWTFRHPLLDELIGAVGMDETDRLQADIERETNRFRTGKNLHAYMDGKLFRALANLVTQPTTANVERQSAITEPGASAPGQHEEN